MSILVVSDAPRLRDQMVDYLEEGGFEGIRAVDSPEDARRALRLDDHLEPDEDWRLMVVDLKRQDESALELCRTCTSNLATRDMPILAVTRNTDPRTLRSVFEAGCTDFLSPPLHGVVLRHRAKKALKLSEKQNQDVQQLQEELNQARAEIHRLSNLDELAGIPSREQFQTALEQEWARLRRSEVSLSVLMIDIDAFGEYEKRYGKDEADEQFGRVAEALQGALKRPGDTLTRHARADFAVLLPETDLEGARAVAQGLMEAVRDLRIEHFDSATDYLTVSVGLGSLVPSGEHSPERLLEGAEEALRDAREAGGDQLVALPLR